MGRPWLSILVPVYNVRPYLEACFDSFMPQLDAGVEVVAVEDGSTDGSDELLKTLARRWPGRIRIEQHPQNRGLSAARNTLVGAASGDYLWFIDSDDLMEPGAVAALKAAVESHQPDLLLCDYRVLRERSGLKHRLRGEGHRRTFRGPAGELLQDNGLVYSGLLLAGHMHVWSKIGHRRLWESGVRFPVGRHFEDTHVSPRLAVRARSVLYCDQVWLAYRQHAGSILGQINERKLLDLMGHLKGLAADLQASALAQDPQARFALAYLCDRSLIGALRQFDRRATPEPQWEEARSAYRQAMPLDNHELRRGYLQRGWLLRWLRLRYWLMRTR